VERESSEKLYPLEETQKQRNRKKNQRKPKMQKFKQSQAVYMYIRARVKINQCIKTIPFMDERRKFWFLQEGTRENSRKKMKSARTSANDGTVPETCDFKGLNVNLRSARDVKSQPRDWATCLWITVWTRRRHFSALCLSCHRKPRKTVGRSHILFAEQVVSSRLGGLCTVRSSGVDQSQHGGIPREESFRKYYRTGRTFL